MPPLLRDIVRNALDSHPDITVVGESPHGAGLHRTLAQTQPDVVVVGTVEPDGFAMPRHILATYPQTRVLMLADTGRSAVMYELIPHRTPLGEVSPQALVDAIRFGMAPAAWGGPGSSG